MEKAMFSSSTVEWPTPRDFFDKCAAEFGLALGFLRYEALRKLNVEQFREMFLAHLAGGKPFDELVDELVVKGAKP